jgi:hypothetical protein
LTRPLEIGIFSTTAQSAGEFRDRSRDNFSERSEEKLDGEEESEEGGR